MTTEDDSLTKGANLSPFFFANENWNEPFGKAAATNSVTFRLDELFMSARHPNNSFSCWKMALHWKW